MSKSVREIALEAASLIRKTGWTQGAFARDSSGNSVKAMSADAVCFCLYGSAYRVNNALDLTIFMKAVAKEIDKSSSWDGVTGHKNMMAWNEAAGRKKSEVLFVLDGISGYRPSLFSRFLNFVKEI